MARRALFSKESVHPIDSFSLGSGMPCSGRDPATSVKLSRKSCAIRPAMRLRMSSGNSPRSSCTSTSTLPWYSPVPVSHWFTWIRYISRRVGSTASGRSHSGSTPARAK
ncbi:MAG: hypothetical protein HMLKMBBP_00526 [Planctomycetes bacterium]|nr:hypothetical protein [Planctomycetota bacterium]